MASYEDILRERVKKARNGVNHASNKTDRQNWQQELSEAEEELRWVMHQRKFSDYDEKEASRKMAKEDFPKDFLDDDFLDALGF